MKTRIALLLQRFGIDATPCGHEHDRCPKFSRHRHVPVVDFVLWR